MNPRQPSNLRNWFKAELFSPKGFLIRAVLISVAYAVCHAAGLREYTTFLSGTTDGGNLNQTIVLGVTYMAVYFAFVLGVPILLIAAGVMWGVERWVASPTARAGQSS